MENTPFLKALPELQNSHYNVPAKCSFVMVAKVIVTKVSLFIFETTKIFSQIFSFAFRTQRGKRCANSRRRIYVLKRVKITFKRVEITVKPLNKVQKRSVSSHCRV